MSEVFVFPDDDEEVPPEIGRCRPARPLWPEQYPHDPEVWRDERVRAILNGIVKEHAYDRLPILADALEEAGCEDHLLLRHCRECPEHDSTCWVLRASWTSEKNLAWQLPPTMAQRRAVEVIAETVRRVQQREQHYEATRSGSRTRAWIAFVLLTLLAGLTIAMIRQRLRSNRELAEPPRELPGVSQPSEPTKRWQKSAPRQ